MKMLRNVCKYIHENDTFVGGLRKGAQYKHHGETMHYVRHIQLREKSDWKPTVESRVSM